MAKLLVLSVLCALVAGSVAQNAIVGDFPAHVALNIAGGRFGEGVIINQNHVLTLAQNVFNAVNLDVLLAPADITVTSGLTLLPGNPAGAAVQRIYPHDHYNFHNGKFNVAVLRMVNNFVFPLHEPLPAINPVIFHNRIVPEGTNCDFVGFLLAPGSQNRQLTSVVLPVMNREACNALDNPALRGAVYDQHICAGAITAIAANCNFNDGAAYYCNGELAGFRTRGLVCNQANSPALLLQTRWFQNWIPQQLTRTDIIPPGVVPPPGVPRGNGATTVILSTVALVLAAIISLLHL